jgi:cytochrome c biogenesis protein CcdA
VIQYALLVGMLAAFNPCGAPLLPAYLGLFSASGGRESGGRESVVGRIADGLRAGSTMSLGFVVVFAAVGVPLSAIASGLAAWAPGASGLLGVVIIVIAIASLRGRSLPLPGRRLRLRGGRGTVAMLSFGMLYALGSLSCELPLFVAATGVAATRDATTAVLAVAAYAVGMSLVVTTLSVVVALTGHRGRRLRLSAAWIRPAGAVVALAAGVFVVAVAASEIWAPTLAERLTQPLLALQTAVDATFSAGTIWWAAGFAAALALAALFTLALPRREATHG